MRNYLSNKHNQKIDPIWFVLQSHCKGLSKDHSRYSVRINGIFIKNKNKINFLILIDTWQTLPKYCQDQFL